jgi:hypothetical protein
MSKAKLEPGEGAISLNEANPLTRFLASARNHPLPQGGEGKNAATPHLQLAISRRTRFCYWS